MGGEGTEDRNVRGVCSGWQERCDGTINPPTNPIACEVGRRRGVTADT